MEPTTETVTVGRAPASEVARLMAAMAGGDAGALCEFVARCGTELAAVVRRTLLSFGRADVARDRAEVDEIVLSAGIAVFDRAGGWSAGGAPPWVWAERAIRHEVAAHLGNPSVELDPAAEAARSTGAVPAAGMPFGSVRARGAPVGDGRQRSGLPCGIREPDWGLAGAGPTLGVELCGSAPHGSELEALAEHHPAVGLLREAIAAVGTPRDQRVHIEYRIQKSLGDASPARTVATEFGLRPDNVRQIDRRMRVRLERLIETDERYEALRDLAWLAA